MEVRGPGADVAGGPAGAAARAAGATESPPAGPAAAGAEAGRPGVDGRAGVAGRGDDWVAAGVNGDEIAAGAAGAAAAGAAGAAAAGAGDAAGRGAAGRAWPGRPGCGARDEPAPLLGAASLRPAGALVGYASRSLRTTGASMVEDGDFTNSPRSWSLAMISLLVLPSSFASSCTRALPATALLTVRAGGLYRPRSSS
jgi:hypothetical protein